MQSFANIAAMQSFANIAAISTKIKDSYLWSFVSDLANC